MKAFLRQVYQYIRVLKLDHLFFWVLYVLFWTSLFFPGNNFLNAFFNSIIILAFHAGVCYFNNYFLIPEFLLKRRYVIYLVSVLLSILAVIFPLALIFHGFFSIDEESKSTIWSFSFFIFNYSSVLFSVAITSMIKLSKSWYVREQAHKDLKKLNIETELRFLKSQINPHFLFNVLNSLYALTLKQSPKAPDMVLKLSNILRYVLYEGASKKKVPFSKEIEYLESYLELEKVRLGERVEVVLDIKGNFEHKEIEPLLFINFVENSFKHGASSKIKDAWVKITLTYFNDILEISIRNNLPSSKKVKDKNLPGGIGLANSKKRLELLYPNKHELVILETEKEFNVNLKIDLS